MDIYNGVDEDVSAAQIIAVNRGISDPEYIELVFAEDDPIVKDYMWWVKNEPIVTDWYLERADGSSESVSDAAFTARYTVEA
jgi:hypothetical protein